jgi:hypothetical protein
MSIVNVSPGENDQSRLQDTGAADIWPARWHYTRKTPFYFNELSGHVNEKIRTPNGWRQEQPCPKPGECSMDLL